METTETSQFLDSYRKADDDVLNRPHSVKEARIGTEQLPVITLYSDGSARTAEDSPDGRSFAGWGYYAKCVHFDGSFDEIQRNGNLFNGSVKEGELRAVLEGLILASRTKSHIHVVSDSAYVVKGLRDIEMKSRQLGVLRKKNPRDYTVNDWYEVRHLKLWDQIGKIIKFNKNIASFETRWVRSHSLDAIAEHELPDPADVKSPRDRQIIEDCIGNYVADQQAGAGVEKASTGCLQHLHANQDLEESSPKDFKHSVQTSQKNFDQSYPSRLEAIHFLAGKPNDYIKPETLEKIFGKGITRMIDDYRRDPDGFCRSHSYGSRVIYPFGGSTKSDKGSLIQKLKERHKPEHGLAKLGRD